MVSGGAGTRQRRLRRRAEGRDRGWEKHAGGSGNVRCDGKRNQRARKARGRETAILEAPIQAQDEEAQWGFPELSPAILSGAGYHDFMADCKCKSCIVFL